MFLAPNFISSAWCRRGLGARCGEGVRRADRWVCMMSGALVHAVVVGAAEGVREGVPPASVAAGWRLPVVLCAAECTIQRITVPLPQGARRPLRTPLTVTRFVVVPFLSF